MILGQSRGVNTVLNPRLVRFLRDRGAVVRSAAGALGEHDLLQRACCRLKTTILPEMESISLSDGASGARALQQCSVLQRSNHTWIYSVFQFICRVFSSCFLS